MLRPLRVMYLPYIFIIFVAALSPLNARGAEMTLAKDEVGQLWIQIIGRIDEGDDLKFKSILVDAIHRDEQITDVATFSQGGLTHPAMNIGKYIRTMHLRTVAPYLVPVVRRHICYISAMAITEKELNNLTSISGVPWLKELLRARCGHYAASSPAALECENTVIRELYWNGARELLSQSE